MLFDSFHIVSSYSRTKGRPLLIVIPCIALLHLVKYSIDGWHVRLAGDEAGEQVAWQVVHQLQGVDAGAGNASRVVRGRKHHTVALIDESLAQLVQGEGVHRVDDAKPVDTLWLRVEGSAALISWACRTRLLDRCDLEELLTSLIFWMA